MAANDLTTLAAVKAWLRISSTNDDSLLSSLITAASTYIETYCDRQFVSQQYTEVRNGRGTRAMNFANYPVTAVSSVMIGSNVITPAVPVGQQGFPGSGYVFSDTLLMLYGYCFWPGLANVQLVYTAGYQTIPADLAQLANELTGLRYKQAEHIGVTGQIGVDGQHIGFDDAAMTPSIALGLEQYRKRIPL